MEIEEQIFNELHLGVLFKLITHPLTAGDIRTLGVVLPKPKRKAPPCF
jgi:hypothetical protein